MSNQTYYEQSREMANVMLAYADGKEIEHFDSASNKWEVATRPSWDWGQYNYRIKPERILYTPDKLPQCILARVVSCTSPIELEFKYRYQELVGKIIVRVKDLFIIPGIEDQGWDITALNKWKVVLRCELINGPVTLTNSR